ncbi:ABC transporter ATP-binding protein [Christensenella sp. MSJ-20]|uniref:ABC transporter ATP-binding protein n=1 Tax=Christensenella sp. MSJ-20 TaxID=2841518 RepID=UPI0037BF6025
MLEIKDLHVKYGAIHAIQGVSLGVDEGEVVSLIGANGAGKTTILHTISGLVKAASGSIELLGTNLLKTNPSAMIRLGLAHVPEGRRIFASMTVDENLEMGAFVRKDRDAVREEIREIYERFPRLMERRNQIAGTLSGGEQQMLAIGRALMGRPKLLLMDEPSMGLAPILVREIFKIIQELKASGMTVLLIEQNARLALSIADRAYVLETGRIVMEGNAQELLENDQVRKAYLGA